MELESILLHELVNAWSRFWEPLASIDSCPPVDREVELCVWMYLDVRISNTFSILNVYSLVTE